MDEALFKKFLEYEKTEDFRKKSYTEQLQTRAAFFNKYGAQDFVNVPQETATKYFNAFVYRAPEMGNPEHDKYAQMHLDGWINPSLNKIANPTAEQKQKQADQMQYQLGTSKESFADFQSYLSEEKAKGNITDKPVDTDTASDFISKFSSAGNTAGMGWMATIPLQVAGATGAMPADQAQAVAFMQTADFQKIKDYSEYKLSSINPDYSGKISDAFAMGQTATLIGTTIGSSIAGPSKLLENSAKSLITSSLGTMALNPVVEATLVNLTPNLIQATAEAASWTSFDTAQRWNSGLAPKNQEEITAEAFKIGKAFGEYAIMDYAINLGVGLGLPMAKVAIASSLKGYAGKGLSSEGAKLLNDLQNAKSIDELYDRFSASSPELRSSLPDYLQDAIQTRIDMSNILKNDASLISANPMWEGRLAADLHKFNNVYSDGTYRLRLSGEPDKYVRTIDSTPGLYQALADHESIIYKNLKKYEAAVAKSDSAQGFRPEVGTADATFANFQNSYKSVANVHALMQGTDSLYDSAYAALKKSPDAPSFFSTNKTVEPSKRFTLFSDELAIMKNSAQNAGYNVLRMDIPNVSGGKGFGYGTIDATINPAGKYVFPSVKMATKEVYDQATAFFTDLQLKGLIPSTNVDDLVKADLLRKGFDSVDAGGGRVTILLGNKVKQVATVMENAKNISNEHPLHLSGKAEQKIPNFKAAVTRQYEQTFSTKKIATNDALMINTLTAVSDNPAKPFMKNLTEDFLFNKTGKRFNVTLKNTGNQSGFSLITKDGNNLELFLPQKTGTLDGKMNFVSSYFNQIQKVIDDTGFKIQVAPKNLDHYVINAAKRFDIPLNPAKKSQWLSSISKKLYNTTPTFSPSGSLTLNTPTGSHIFSNADEAITWIGRNSFSPDELQVALAQDGFKVHHTGDSWAISTTGPGKVKVAVGDSLSKLADDIGWEPNKLPASLAPKEMYIFADKSMTVNITEKGMYGALADTSKFFDNFEDYSKLGTAKSITIQENGRLLGFSPRRFVVQSSILNHDFTVGSQKEATELLNSISSATLDSRTIMNIARDKGISAWRNGSSFYMNDGSGQIKAYAKQSDLLNAMKEIPTPTGAPDIFDSRTMAILDPILAKQGIGPDWVKKQAPLTLPESTLGNIMDKTTGYDAVSRLFTPRSAWLHEASAKIGIPELSKAVQQVEDASDAAKMHTLKNQKHIDAIFTENGKVISAKRCEGLYYYITKERFDPTTGKATALSPEDLDELRKTYGLTDADISERIPKIREVLGDNPHNGLFSLTGMDAYRFLTDYLPRMKQHGLSSGWDKYLQSDAKDLIKGVTSSPDQIKQIEAFFTHARSSEVASFAMEDNVYKLLTMYNTKANKMFFMNGPLQEVKNLQGSLFSKTSNLKNNHMIAIKLNQFCEEISGFHADNTEEWMKKGIYDFATRMKMSPKAAQNIAENLLPALYQSTYVTAMGLKSSNVIRNALQPFMSASILGNDYLSKAAEKLFKPGMDEVFEEMKQFGALFDRPQYLSNYQKSIVRSTWADFSDYAMQGFKNSDEASRFIVWEAAKDRWNYAFSKLPDVPKTKADWIPFFRYTGLNTLNEGFALQTLKRLESGQFKEAKLLYAREMVNQTMFRYDNWNNPWARTFVGRVFGQFGSYSLNYIQMIKKMTSGFNIPAQLNKMSDPVIRSLTRPSFTQSLAYTTQWIANGYAVKHAFEMFRMRGDSFEPLAPIYFDGGPMFKVAVQALGAITAAGFNKQLAYENLEAVTKAISPYQAQAYGNNLKWGFYNYPNLVPGSAQYRAITKAKKYLDENDYYGAILSLGSFSVLPSDPFGRMQIPFLQSDDPLLTGIAPAPLQQLLRIEESTP